MEDGKCFEVVDLAFGSALERPDISMGAVEEETMVVHVLDAADEQARRNVLARRHSVRLRCEPGLGFDLLWLVVAVVCTTRPSAGKQDQVERSTYRDRLLPGPRSVRDRRL